MGLITTKLGRTNLEVTKLGLGAFQFTVEFNVDPEEADRILDYALESGINFIDTAQMYGFGESEQLVGRALHRHPDKKVAVSTKVGYIDRSVGRLAGEKGLQDYKTIMRTIKHSMWLLRRDFVEVLMVHEPNFNHWWGFNYETGDAVIMEVLEDLKKEGVIGAIGLGGWDNKVATQLVNTGRFDVVLSAGGIGLAGKAPGFEELLEATRRHNVGVIVGAVFGMGIKTELLSIDRSLTAQMQQSEDENERLYGMKVDKIYDIAEELETNMFELAIRYVMAFDDIHCNIAGARELAHIKANVASALKGPLEPEYVQRINEIHKMKL